MEDFSLAKKKKKKPVNIDELDNVSLIAIFYQIFTPTVQKTIVGTWNQRISIGNIQL